MSTVPNAVLHSPAPRNVGWQPSSSAGLCVHYSPSRDAVVLHGGVTPGRGRTGEIAVGALMTAAAGAAASAAAPSGSSSGGGRPRVPEIAWSKLVAPMIPRRSHHGSALLSGGRSGHDRLLLFGGEGDPPRSSDGPALGPAGPAMLNDGWTVDLHSGHALPLVATEGSPPSPRTHHACVAIRVDGGSRAPSRSASPPPSPGGVSFAAAADAEAGWLILVLGGRTGVSDDTTGAEDAVHVLRLSADGSRIQWQPSVEYMSEAIAARQQHEAHSRRLAEQEQQQAGGGASGGGGGSPRAAIVSAPSAAPVGSKAHR